MKIRQAKATDKKEVFGFSAHTFSWGDYIDQVWDIWYSESKDQGVLLVTELDNHKPIALSHTSLLSDEKNIWLEGIRVHSQHRRQKIASKLVKEMLNYGRTKRAKSALAIVSHENRASQRMLEKIGFKIISKWVYYSTTDSPMKIRKRFSQKSSPDARIASRHDLDKIWNYLKQSKIFRLSAKRYVSAWHWRLLDKKALAKLVQSGRVIMAGNPVSGIAIINKGGYWKRTGIIQVVYLDSASKQSLQNLMSSVADLYAEGKFNKLHVICHHSKSMVSVVETFGIEESELFLLYEKKIL